MSNTAPDTSRISFTALYTSHVWQRNDLGDPALDTKAGAWLYAALAPANYISNLLRPGLTLETMLLQRHHLIDHLLEQAIEKRGISQIVEVASGLSPRGIRFRKRYADKKLRYIEADLPAMAARKRQLLEKSGHLDNDHRVVDCNALLTSGPGSLVRIFYENLDLSKPAAIVTEGLVNYFSPADLGTMWSGFAAALGQCPRGVYVSDIVFDLGHLRVSPIVAAFKGALEAMTRGKTYLHFVDSRDCCAALEQDGFVNPTIHDPKGYEDLLNLPQVNGNSIVHVLSAETIKP